MIVVSCASAVAPSNTRPFDAPVTEFAASGALVASVDNTGVPLASGIVMVLSAVGSVTAMVVSKSSAVAPSNTRELLAPDTALAAPTVAVAE